MRGGSSLPLPQQPKRTEEASRERREKRELQLLAIVFFESLG
jgi:hypothetical protein